MPKPMESHLQAVVREVVARVLQEAAPFDASALEAAEPAHVERLRKLIDDADQAWQQRNEVVALQSSSFYWSPTSTLTQVEQDGPVVEVRWGFHAHEEGAPPQLRMTGDSAIDFGVELLKLFEDENGEVQRPERPPEPPPHGGLSKMFDEMSELGDQYLKVIGRGERGYSWLEVRAWVDAGKPQEHRPHDFEDVPEDDLKICRVCGHYYVVEDGYPLSEVCQGAPLQPKHALYKDSIHYFDPRRSDTLRELQRRDKVMHYMRLAGATMDEMDFVDGHRTQLEARLSAKERERYYKERAGLPADA